MTEWKDHKSIPMDGRYVLVLDLYGQYFVGKYAGEGKNAIATEEKRTR